MKIAVDAMGGDVGIPDINVNGACLAVEEQEDLEVILVGPKNLLHDIIEKNVHSKKVKRKLSVVDAPEIVSMEDQPSKVLRTKQNSSISIGMKLLKQNIVDAFVSAGNSGAVLAFALTQIGTVANVSRPAIATVLPTISSPCVLLDVGANVDCKPQHLLEFALMGKIYCEKLLNKQNPKVGLLSIGTEEGKGNTQSLLAYQLLAKQKDLNFIGNIEGKDIPFGIADVIVVDGFVGNIILKFGEGVAEMLLKLIKSALKRHPFAWLSLPFVWNAIRDLRKKIDFTEYGGAPLLGLEKVCIISHGRSNSKAIKNAILTAKQMVEKQINIAITELMGKIYEK